LTQVLGFVAVLILTRVLEQELFGFLAMAAFWSSLLNLRAKAGLNYAAIRLPETSGPLLGTYWVLDLALSAASLGLSGLAAVALPAWGYPRAVVVGVLVLIGAECLGSLASPLSIALERELQVSRLMLVTLFAALAAYAVAIPFALSGGGLWSLLSINVASGAVTSVGVFLVCRQRLPWTFRLRWQFDRVLAGQLFRQGLPTGLSLTALAGIVTQFDNFLIGTFVSYTTLGFYDRAYRIASWPNVLVAAIVSRIGFLTFAKVQSDLPRLTHAVRLSLWILAVLGVPMALGLYFGAGEIVQILYGARWAASVPFLRFLAFYSLAWPFVSVAFWLSAALGHSRASAGLTAAQALLIVGLGWPLTYVWGVVGTLMAVGVTVAAAFLLSNLYIFRQVPLRWHEVYGAPGLAGLAAFGVMLAVKQLPGWGALAPVMRLAGTGLGVAGGFAIFLFALQRDTLRERVRYLRALWPAPNAMAGDPR
jgi:O-antigen/teichoic acid export membrane protein